MECEDRKDQIALYAADALNPEEVTELEQHLRDGCARCRRELAEARNGLALTLLPSDPVEPPPDLKRRVMTAVGRPGVDAPDRSPEQDEAPAPVRTRSRRRRRAAARNRAWKWAVPGLAAALAAIITYGALAYSMQQQQETLRMLEAKIASLESQGHVRREQLDQINLTMRSWADLVGALQSSTVHVISLTGVEREGYESQASGRLLLDPKGGKGYLRISGLNPPDDPPDDRKQYSVWFGTEENKRVEAGPLHVNESGAGWLVIDVPEGLSKSAKVHIGYSSEDNGTDRRVPLLAGEFSR